MKAAVYTNYGPPEVLSVQEVEKPVPASNEVLIEVHFSTVNRTDTGFRSAQYFVSRFVTGLMKPKRPVAGSEFSGKIVEIGSEVTSFNIGDRVFGFEDVQSGAHAEFMAVDADGSLAKIPVGLSYQAVAAAGEGATYAVNVINATKIAKGQKVLIYGASGAIGSAAVQIVKYIGADVTAVCGTKNIALVKSLGADKVIDYQKTDFTSITEKYDLVFDAVGKSSYGACKKLLNLKGTYYSTELGYGAQNPLLALWFAVLGSRRVIFPIPKINQETMRYIQHLVEVGAFKPVIDRIYTISEIVEATSYVETGQKTGNVLIKIK